MRSLNVERYVLRWRTRRGRTTAIYHLDLLAVALQPKGYRYVELYRAEEFPAGPPLLWVFAFSRDEHVKVAVTVHATSGGAWGYYEAGRGRRGYLSPCGDAKTAADQVDGILKRRMFPSTW
ncbi:hypothetical protein [Actinomadura rubrisoli]|uniref:Uncharacterized protein n=1 Tax=Actinomadura rubrisoli TaxID=2530368 RepID=A0A4V2YVA9_9ACTN|nr:hypothetical protein [Actinomadura rubrisoli]TDD80777.1 hypothetical protein E1298_25280 [Actinomadura rubrisoli]